MAASENESLHADVRAPFELGEQDPAALNFAEILRDCLDCAVLLVDSDRRIRGFSPQAETLTGLSSNAVLGKHSDLLPSALRELVEESFRAGALLGDRQFSLPDVNGIPSALRAQITLCPGAGGEPSAVVIVLNDLAAAHKLGVNMQRLDRLASIGTLSASMAHEIKNAFVAVNTFVQDLAQRNKDSELSGLVRRELRRIDSILSQMLKFAGPAKPAFSRVSLHRILDQSLRLIQPQLETKQIRLRRSFAARPDLVEGDGYQLEQAFLNLLLNAIAAMEPQGQLSVSTEVSASGPVSGPAEGPAENWVQVAIADTGAGIPADQLERLFEPFFSTKPQGTGLGLAITRRIVLEHRGKITVESELQKGTTFRLAIPCLRA